MPGSATKIVWANTISLVIMLFANLIAGSGLMIGKTVGEVSNTYDTLFAPAGYAFIIWSVIFLLLISYCSYQWYLLKRGDPQNYITRNGFWFMWSNVANVVWLFCWLNEWLALSVIVIFMLLTCLCVLAIRLRLELDDEPVQIILFVWWPITIYMGWVMVATIACVAAWLQSIGFTGGFMGAETCTIVMLAIATALYLILIKKRNVREAALVGVWAFVAIAAKQYQLQRTISVTASIASFVLLVAVILHGYKNSPTSPFAKLRRGEW